MNWLSEDVKKLINSCKCICGEEIEFPQTNAITWMDKDGFTTIYLCPKHYLEYHSKVLEPSRKRDIRNLKKFIKKTKEENAERIQEAAKTNGISVA